MDVTDTVGFYGPSAIKSKKETALLIKNRLFLLGFLS